MRATYNYMPRNKANPSSKFAIPFVMLMSTSVGSTFVKTPLYDAELEPALLTLVAN
jgi:hypothetical protein